MVRKLEEINIISELLCKNSKTQKLLLSIVNLMKFSSFPRLQTLNTTTIPLFLLPNSVKCCYYIITILCFLPSSNKLLLFLANVLDVSNRISDYLVQSF